MNRKLLRRDKRKEKIKKESQETVTRPKSMERIVKEQIEESMEEYRRSNKALFLSALTAGLDLGFSLLVIGVLYTMFNDQLSMEVMQVVLALAYPIGFIFVILGRSALFTEHTTLAVLPVLNGRESLKDLSRIWGIIYLGNLIGGYIIGAAIAYVGPRLGLVTYDALEDIAKHLIDYSAPLILVSAILAGWLMGLVSWLATSSKETIARIVVVIIVTAVIGLGGLHHSIVGSTEVFAGMLSSDEISLSDYFVTQFWSTIGNIIGGVFFVSILKYQVTQD
ncbi:MAG: formate/nitrite transporter family protein [Phaeodactylibacter xiamenensis]|uniref:Formate transporter n=1 Tax=Phaeodactylibacter xiamenensis TaxID=1524460 RepID=A0A098SCX1_9BACT|nr:formate/nitrite transporter family protein [Phaeodactylibacter xiamenensis]KGE89523.1 formate transporter [Phaeodactylibacter xiamenensis]MCR9054056.1 formate/nitrite transporter family protein [bacterium]